MEPEFEFEPAKHIKLDLYPATLTRLGDDGNVIAPECRLIVTDSHFYAISTDGVGQPYFILKEELVDFFDAEKGGGYEIDGATYDYTAERNGSCGCGSRLRSMRLLPGVPHISRLAFKTK